MAHVAETEQRPKFIVSLLTALRQGLNTAGIEAEVDTEAVPGTKLHRVIVVSPNFSDVRQGERQDLVWRIADKVLKREEALRVSMIITVTPAELTGASAPTERMVVAEEREEYGSRRRRSQRRVP
mgnify:CR=1 FL=1